MLHLILHFSLHHSPYVSAGAAHHHRYNCKPVLAPAGRARGRQCGDLSNSATIPESCSRKQGPLVKRLNSDLFLMKTSPFIPLPSEAAPFPRDISQWTLQASKTFISSADVHRAKSMPAGHRPLSLCDITQFCIKKALGEKVFLPFSRPSFEDIKYTCIFLNYL
uniref:Uncharacterized protein n=1 Tax=Dromaius novaehollandiae TaxID=8790 RepID=A0A8C4PA14_DRONO